MEMNQACMHEMASAGRHLETTNMHNRDGFESDAVTHDTLLVSSRKDEAEVEETIHPARNIFPTFDTFAQTSLICSRHSTKLPGK